MFEPHINIDTELCERICAIVWHTNTYTLTYVKDILYKRPN